jgi:hypothetical protein
MSSITNSTITTMDMPATDIDKPTKVCTWENSSSIVPETIQAYFILAYHLTWVSPLVITWLVVVDSRDFAFVRKRIILPFDFLIVLLLFLLLGKGFFVSIYSPTFVATVVTKCLCSRCGRHGCEQ